MSRSGRRSSTRVLAECLHCSYDEAMPNITIRNVEPWLLEALKKKAESSGQSLQKFLSATLTQIASTQSNAEIIRDYRERMKEIDEPWPTREQIDEALALAKEERDNPWKRWL